MGKLYNNLPFLRFFLIRNKFLEGYAVSCNLAKKPCYLFPPIFIHGTCTWFSCAQGVGRF